MTVKLVGGQVQVQVDSGRSKGLWVVEREAEGWTVSRLEPIDELASRTIGEWSIPVGTKPSELASALADLLGIRRARALLKRMAELATDDELAWGTVNEAHRILR